MKSQDLRSNKTPLKEQYRTHPETALVTLKAEGHIGADVTRTVATGHALVEAGLHPAAGGTGLHACTGTMLLEALALRRSRQIPALTTLTGPPFPFRR